jgi:hypothetical protein
MNGFFDTSVLVPVFYGDHSHHQSSMAPFIRFDKSLGLLPTSARGRQSGWNCRSCGRVRDDDSACAGSSLNCYGRPNPMLMITRFPPERRVTGRAGIEPDTAAECAFRQRRFRVRCLCNRVHTDRFLRMGRYVCFRHAAAARTRGSAASVSQKVRDGFTPCLSMRDAAAETW